MDALSEALKSVRMTGAIFFNAEFTAPWGFAAPSAEVLAPRLSAGAERLVIYHLVTEGTAVASAEGVDDLHLKAGDVVIVPGGNAHRVFNGSPAHWVDSATSLGDPRDLRIVRHGGGGEATRFVCGFFGCERQTGRLFLAGLPRMLKINIRGDATGEWMEGCIRHLVSETMSERPGQVALLSKMAEALVIETLRRYMEQLPPEQTGWFAGARDPVAGAVLELLHRKPCHAWTLAELAAEVGASRSVIAQRFAHFVGESPMSYLARWRLHLAARLLEGDRKTMLQVALDVGYESEAAFNRAFKREFGLPPAHYRRKLAQNGAGSAQTGPSLPARPLEAARAGR